MAPDAVTTKGAAGSARPCPESVPRGVGRADRRAAFEALGAVLLVQTRSGRSGCSKAAVRFQEAAAAEAAV